MRLFCRIALLICLFTFSLSAEEPPAGRQGAALAPPSFAKDESGGEPSFPGQAETAGYSTREETLPALPMAPAPALLSSEESRQGANLRSDLVAQLGKAFHVARQDDIYIASDIDLRAFQGRVYTTLLLCRRALQTHYFQAALSQPVVIYAFRDRESYVGHLRTLWNEAPLSPYGHYNYQRRHIVFNYQTGLGTMIHELTHAMMDSEMPYAPIWFAEGLASLYEQCRIEGDRILGVHNWRLPELQRKLDTAEYTSLPRLLLMDEEAFKAKESLHYSEARYFCMYMEELDLLRLFYRLYRDGFDRDPSGRRFVEEVFGHPLPVVEQEWKSWIRSLPDPSGTFTVHPGPSTEKKG